jgi:RNA polymerase sigma-70 factor (ECF subfamily)
MNPAASQATATAARASGEVRDTRAFELLMRQNNRRLFRVARSLLSDDEESQDALQEAYLSAFRAMGQFRGEAQPSTWLTRIVVNQCMSRLRRGARRDNIVPMVAPLPHAQGGEGEVMDDEPVQGIDEETPDLAVGRAELRALLERRIDELPQDYRVVFVMRSIEELSVEETAACLGIPEATVRTRHFRARSLLRESIAQDIDVAERDVYRFGGARCDRIVAAVLKEIDAAWRPA